MSVLIKGMKMPESCHQCVAGYGGFCFVCSAEDDGVCPDHGRPEWCPLVELPPHGRLIDADVICAECKRVAEEYYGIYPDCAYCPVNLAPADIEAMEGEG